MPGNHESFNIISPQALCVKKNRLIFFLHEREDQSFF
jgi:hypothetical protein